jgi:poly-gamma-glutamate capsule biosynthesis protein CapA/YwtB (metallophosphatase superfamily)
VRARLVDPTTTLAPIADALSAADVTVVNLETAVTERGAPEPKTYTFRVAPVAFYALAAAGVDVVTMANNHAVDYGPEAPADTLAAIEAVPLPVVGIGTNERQAFAPAVIDVPGTTIAVFGATDVPDRTAAAGRPTSSCTCTTARSGWAARQRSSDIVSALAAAAADVVVGSHAHVLLGPGWFGRTYVSYGLGNFVWYTPSSVAEATRGVLTLTVREGSVVDVSWTPTLTGQDGMRRVLSDSDGEQAVADWADLRGCTGLAGSLDAAEAMS